MSSKEILKPYILAANEDMSTDFVSDITNVQRLDRIAIQISYTGTPVGDFDVETSLDYVPGLVDGTWIPLRLTPAPAAAGVADDIIIDLTVTAVPYIRVAYTATSSDGYCGVIISGKES